MKKQLTLILALLLALSLVSCGGQPTGTTKDEGDTGTHENPVLTDNTDINHTDNGEQTAQTENSITHAPADVYDTSGRFNGEDGSPYQYYGHGSWQYFFNNEAVCNEDGISCWEWMAQKAK